MLFRARSRMMRITPPLLVLAASLLSAPVAMALNEYGIEGMGMVSPRADEGRATISADGQRIVFARRSESGWGLWEARVADGRWQQAQPLPVDVAGEARDPYLSRDGRWLLFAAGRQGTLALYRAALSADGRLGAAQALAGDGGRREERGPALSADGQRLLFARQQGRGAGWDMFVAPLDAQGVRGRATALGALNSAEDETDADWLGNDGAVVFSRGSGATAQVWSSGCAWSGVALQPLGLSFNQPGGWTGAPVIDNAKPGEMLVASSAAKAPRAGGVDVYRLAVPKVAAVPGCVPTLVGTEAKPPTKVGHYQSIAVSATTPWHAAARTRPRSAGHCPCAGSARPVRPARCPEGPAHGPRGGPPTAAPAGACRPARPR
ncbi:hypothetical protein G6F31_014380 [Rhizopus arrhizus]|nr:hypothetical protein G6F31_014380 [Rhizopus arrhizus]